MARWQESNEVLDFRNGELETKRRKLFSAKQSGCKDSTQTRKVRLKPLPHSLESEQCIIGCCLTDAKCIAEAQLVIRNSEFFYDLRHQTIWEVITDNPTEANIITVQQRLKDRGLLDNIGGIGYLNDCQDAVPSTAHLPVWLNDVESSYTRRRLIGVASSIIVAANDENDVAGLLDASERAILEVRPASRKSDDIKALVNEAINKLEWTINNPGKLGGFTTGLMDMDRLTDGVHCGEMVVIAGYTSTGKTALAVNIATINGIAGIPVAIFTAEMMPVQIVIRQLCSTAKANAKKLTEGDIAPLTMASAQISHAPIFVESATGMTIGQVQAVARRLRQKHEIKIVVVDYVQLLTGTGDNREQQIASISKGLKAIAIELNCCVLALSQLTDDGKLRESRAIGHDADSVWKLENSGDWQPIVQPIKVNVEKCRDGETGKVELIFQKQFTRFENVARVNDDDVPNYENH